MFLKNEVAQGEAGVRTKENTHPRFSLKNKGKTAMGCEGCEISEIFFLITDNWGFLKKYGSIYQKNFLKNRD